VTSQKDIQDLIADIDRILPNAGSHLPWYKPGDSAALRQVLERVRSYLVVQQKKAASEPLPAANTVPSELNQPIGQSVSQAVDILRSELLQPLQADVAILRQQRESLLAEIRQLEATRQQNQAPREQTADQQQLLAEFSQALMERWQDSFNQRLNTPSSLPTQPQHLEQLSQVPNQFDQLILTLDENQRIIFETFQRNLQSYQESLAQGLENMHNLGGRTEMMFTVLVNRLIQQLGKETSTLESLPKNADDVLDRSQTMPPVGSEPFPPLELSLNTLAKPSVAKPSQFPFAGMEMTSTGTAPNTPSEEEDQNQDTPPLNEDSDRQETLPDAEAMDALIQIDLDESQSLFPETEGVLVPELSNRQELEAWLSQLESSPSGVEGRERLPEEIDELYESLFGTNAVSPPLPLDEPDLVGAEAEEAIASQTAPEIDPAAQQPPLSQPVNSLSTQMKDALFDGISDPANLTPETPLPLEQSTGSWEEILFSPNSPPIGFLDADLPDKATTTDRVDAVDVSLPNVDVLPDPEGTEDSERSEKINALTDLFEEMGIEADNSPNSPDQFSGFSSWGESTVSATEENYDPASPNEDLLSSDRASREQNRDLRLDQTTLQQLSEDLHRFEGLGLPQPSTLENPLTERTPTADTEAFERNPPESTAGLNPGNQTFPDPTEVLAEDGEYQLDTTSGEETSSLKAEESDFDPGLFPTEELTLDEVTLLNGEETSPESSDTQDTLPPPEAFDIDPEFSSSEAVTEAGEAKDQQGYQEPEAEAEISPNTVWEEAPNLGTEEVTPSANLALTPDLFPEAFDWDQQDEIADEMFMGWVDHESTAITSEEAISIVESEADFSLEIAQVTEEISEDNQDTIPPPEEMDSEASASAELNVEPESETTSEVESGSGTQDQPTESPQNNFERSQSDAVNPEQLENQEKTE
jgi:hypothetical protein